MEQVRIGNRVIEKSITNRMQLVTTDDLETFKESLLQELRAILKEEKTGPESRRWLKSYEVRRMLNLSSGTLHTLRCNGTLPFTKMGGALYYDYEDIQRILSEQKRGGIRYR